MVEWTNFALVLYHQTREQFLSSVFETPQISPSSPPLKIT